MNKDYYIEIPHFYSFEYHEGDKMMIIELDFRDRVLYLEPDMITKWEKPYDDLEITYEEKLKILHKIRECLLLKRRPQDVIIEEGEEKND